jgi:hypothetical protein
MKKEKKDNLKNVFWVMVVIAALVSFLFFMGGIKFYQWTKDGPVFICVLTCLSCLLCYEVWIFCFISVLKTKSDLIHGWATVGMVISMVLMLWAFTIGGFRHT